MLVAYLVISIFLAQCQCLIPALQQDDDQQLIQCVVNILNEYFTERVELTYVNVNTDDELLLKEIYSTMNFSLISRNPIEQMSVPNLGYLVSTTDVADFIENFEYLTTESPWNPYARFLIVIRSIQITELSLVFDELLRLHVNNALVVNGTNDTQLYSYNPFDNYACGKYYTTIIKYGLCSETIENLFPEKLVTGLQKCNFIASIRHRPPFAINPSKINESKPLLGTEEFIINLLGEKLGFTVTFNYNLTVYTSVSPNITAVGSLILLLRNHCDLAFGGMTMGASRAEGFTVLWGYHDYSDELQFFVKAASLVPTWKYIYLEFELDVWALLIVAFVIYSIIAIILLHAADSGEVVLRLLDNLLLHGRHVRTRMSVKCVLITWVWFAYLINTFYQSNLFSFTTQPSMDFQVADEEDLVEYNFEPCFSSELRSFLVTENSQWNLSEVFEKEGCLTTKQALDTINSTDKVYTLVPNYYYEYNERHYDDKWGFPLVYQFEKPYAKLLFGYFFYKGFPITQSLKLNTLRMRESGLADKSLADLYYLQKLKQRIVAEYFESRFFFPWPVCVLGVVLATITFIIELLTKHKHRFGKYFQF